MKLHALALAILANSACEALAQEHVPPHEISIVEVSPSDIATENSVGIFSNNRIFVLSRESTFPVNKNENKLIELFPAHSEARLSRDSSTDLTTEAKILFDPAAVIVIDNLNSGTSSTRILSKDGINHNIPRDPIPWGGTNPVPLPIPKNKNILIGNITLSAEQSEELLKSIENRSEKIPLFTVNEIQ